MKSRQKPRKKNGRGLLIYFTLFLCLMGVGLFSYSVSKEIPDPHRITERTVAESTKIYDRSGEIILYEIHGEEKRTVIPLSEIPTRVRDAAIAAEDLNFYKHRGLDGKGIFRALLINLSRGSITQGGSTITQQLVKNSLLTGERTFTRKIKEAILAILIERRYSKDEILELYLNQIPYGSNAYGIESASESFFGKHTKDLTLGESALLAALPKAPTYYSPYGSHREELFARRDWIIDRMAEEGLIAKEAGKSAKNDKIIFSPPKNSIRAPHFSLYVREYLTQKYGEEAVERGGLRVITTLDWKLQKKAEEAVKDGARANNDLVGAANASLTAIDPKTGEILVMVGSRDYWEKPIPEGCNPGLNCKFDPHVNITLRPRQPGSAFKPFVYATAFKKGYTPETVLFDVPTEFNVNCNADGSPGGLVSDPSSCYHPENYDGKFRGPVSLRQSIAQSLNVPSVKLLYLAGVFDSIETAKNMGISTLGNPNHYGLTLVLGGAEVKLLEMVSAFGVFAANGILHPPVFILRVENSKRDVVEEKKDVSLPVIDTNIARVINDVLSDNDARVPIFNPRSALYFPDRSVAAKTGTTQDYRDAWVIGYTPSLVAGVWVGNNDNTAMNRSAASVMVAAPIWHKFLESALAEHPAENFDPPEYSGSEKPVLRGLYREGPIVKIDKISSKLATIYTPPELIEEQSFGEIRSILYLLKKNDPLGASPSDPYEDPQYKNWQTAIEVWLGSHLIPKTFPPIKFDDIHVPEKKPKIELIAPVEKVRELKEITVKIKSAFPLREVSLLLNSELVDAKIAPLLYETITFNVPSDIYPGDYEIKIIAYDAVGNREELLRTISVQP